LPRADQEPPAREDNAGPAEPDPRVVDPTSHHQQYRIALASSRGKPNGKSVHVMKILTGRKSSLAVIALGAMLAQGIAATAQKQFSSVDGRRSATDTISPAEVESGRRVPQDRIRWVKDLSPISTVEENNQGGVLVGPCGLAGAMGLTGTNDDFTDRSLAVGVINLALSGITTAAGSVVFRNTVQNVGAADDTFVITAPAVPAGFTVEVSVNDGAKYVALQPGTGVELAVAYRAAAIVFVRVTAPAGIKVLTGFDTVICARSTQTPAASNDTIDRLYTGFVQLEKTVKVINATGTGGPNDVVPGAMIEFSVTYANVTHAGGSGSSLLTASNLVINEDGRTAPNTWGITTEHIVGASDSQGGFIIGDLPGSASLSDIVTSLGPGESGVFKFRRLIK